MRGVEYPALRRVMSQLILKVRKNFLADLGMSRPFIQFSMSSVKGTNSSVDFAVFSHLPPPTRKMVSAPLEMHYSTPAASRPSGGHHCSRLHTATDTCTPVGEDTQTDIDNRQSLGLVHVGLTARRRETARCTSQRCHTSPWATGLLLEAEVLHAVISAV